MGICYNTWIYRRPGCKDHMTRWRSTWAWSRKVVKRLFLWLCILLLTGWHEIQVQIRTRKRLTSTYNGPQLCKTVNHTCPWWSMINDPLTGASMWFEFCANGDDNNDLGCASKLSGTHWIRAMVRRVRRADDGADSDNLDFFMYDASLIHPWSILSRRNGGKLHRTSSGRVIQCWEVELNRLGVSSLGVGSILSNPLAQRRTMTHCYW